MTYRYIIDKIYTEKLDIELQQLVSYINLFYRSEGDIVRDIAHIEKFKRILDNYYIAVKKRKLIMKLMGKKHPDEEISNEHLEILLKDELNSQNWH